MTTAPRPEEAGNGKNAQPRPSAQTNLARFCVRHHIHRLSIVHSQPTGTPTRGDRYDMLVEFEDGKTPSKFELVGMEIELTRQIGFRVDLRTYDELKRNTSAHLLEGAKIIYAA